MKKLILSTSIILFIGLSAFAQDGTKKCCDKKGDKKECSKDATAGKKCEPKDCAANLKSGKCKPSDCAAAAKGKDCSKSCAAPATKSTEIKK